jgi:hypothetical protein
MDDIKQRLTDWYNRNIVAGWYRSLALIAGWLTAGAVFLPDLLQFVINYWGILADIALPRFSAESKSLILGLFVAFVAPPLRAWSQKKMQQAALKQAEMRGDAVVIPKD